MKLGNKAPKMFGANQSGQEVLCTIDSKGAERYARYLGSGRFTTAFALGRDNVLLYTFFGDKSKSILAQAHKEFGKDNKHLPNIKRIGKIDYKGHEVMVYSARKYSRVQMGRLTKGNQQLVRALQEAHDEACIKYPYDIVRSRKCGLFNEVIINAEGLTVQMRLALEHLAGCAEDWDDHYIFDSFQVRNLGLDSRGNIVLIDAMFSMDMVQRDFNARQKEQGTD